MDTSIITRGAAKGNTVTSAGRKSNRFHGIAVFLGAAGRLAARSAVNTAANVVHAVQRIRAAASPHLHRDRLPRLGGVFILAAAVIIMMSTTLVGIGLQVYVNGEPVGFVKNRDAFYQVVENVEAKASVILGYPYSLTLDVDYKLEMYNRRTPLDSVQVEQELFNGIDEVDQMYVLKVDGEVLAANSNRDALESVLTGIIDQTLAGEDGTATASFASDVNVELQYTSTENAATISEIENLLTSNVLDRTMYTVTDGDLFSDIAARHGMSVDALTALNPDVNPALIVEGDQLVVGEAIPLMSVLVTKREEYDIVVPYETEYKYSSSMWDGDRVITISGKDGVKHITADVMYADGKETSRDIISEEFVSEPVTEVITLGTRNFIIPFPGYKTISSRFGWRVLNGRYDNHTGIDFAGNYGSKVVASYGGTVEYSGSKGTYGNCVIINHGGGYKTLYAHNSKLAVKVGDKVTQGQTIAYVGSTGRSTGNHCHFEILINGKPVNPSKYLFG